MLIALWGAWQCCRFETLSSGSGCSAMKCDYTRRNRRRSTRCSKARWRSQSRARAPRYAALPLAACLCPFMLCLCHVCLSVPLHACHALAATVILLGHVARTTLLTKALKAWSLTVTRSCCSESICLTLGQCQFATYFVPKSFTMLLGVDDVSMINRV